MESLRWIQQALLEVRKAIRPVVSFLLGWTLVQILIFAPLTAWLLERLISRSGQLAVSNYDIATFLLTPSGLAVVTLGGAANLAFLYAQQGGLFLIASRANTDHALGLGELFWQSIRRLPAFAALGLWQLLALALLFLPFGAAVALVASFLLAGHDINFYLATQPVEWQWTLRLTMVALGGYALAVVFLFFRWILAVPSVLESGEKPWNCLRWSWRTTRSRVFLIARPFLVWWTGWIGVSVVVAGAFMALAQRVLDWSGSDPIRLAPLLVALEGFAVLGATAGALLGGTVHQFLLARLYRELHPPAARVAPWVTPTTVPAVRYKLVLTVILVGAVAISLFEMWRFVNAIPAEMWVDITAHRGSSRQAPENTLSALRQAIADHADYAEIDVQTTRDGEVVLLHDGDLMRVANDPRKLQDLTLAELRQLDVGSWFSPTFKGERLATLSEAIKVARGHIKLNIELKYNRPDPALGPQVLRILRERQFVDDCVITSLDVNALLALKREAPEAQTGMIVTAVLGDATQLPVDFLSLNSAQVSPDAIGRAHAAKKSVHVWTVNDEAAALRMLAMGADNLITDEPALLVNLRVRLRELNRAELIALALRTRFNL